MKYLPKDTASARPSSITRLPLSALEAAVDDEGPLVARPEMLCDLFRRIGHIIHRHHRFYKMGIGEVRVVVQSFDDILEGGDGIFIDGDAEKAMC